MKTRIVTALIVIAVCVPPVILGGIPLEILAVCIVAGACYEWLHTQKEFAKWPVWIPIVCLLLTLGSRFVPERFEMAYFILGLVFFWGLTLIYESFTVENAFFAIVYFFFFALLYRCIGLLVAQSHLYLITIVFATYGSDTGAWFFGRLYGRHKMNPRISPKKSWEGFIGGTVTGFVLGLGVSLFYLGSLNFGLTAVLCLLCPIVAEFGDLCFSAVKRYCSIKDFSDLLPGHGGVLDRVDSLLMNILLFGLLSTLLL